MRLILSCLNIKQFRHTLSKFRTGSHNLEIELGRHQGRPKNDRICKMCGDGIEDELHFMFQCPVYETLRQKYIPRKYQTPPNMHKFNILMSSKSETLIQAVANYLYYAFKLRTELLDTL